MSTPSHTGLYPQLILQSWNATQKLQGLPDVKKKEEVQKHDLHTNPNGKFHDVTTVAMSLDSDRVCIQLDMYLVAFLKGKTHLGMQ